MGNDRLYGERIASELGPHFSRHLHHMASEGLRSKVAIACELAFRDSVIEELDKALHDAINSPKGVVPASAEEFYNSSFYENDE